jgi:hypothetical protein
MNDVFVARARQLRSARELFREESAFASATALLSVHSGIALNDALLTVWSGKPLKGEDHRAAVRATEAQCKTRKVDAAGVRHLAALIHSKAAVSYGDEAVSHQKAEALALAAARFEAWTFKNCKEIAQWEQRQSALVA